MDHYHIKTFYTPTGDRNQPLHSEGAAMQAQRWLNGEWERGYSLHSIVHAPAEDEGAGVTAVTVVRAEALEEAGYRAAVEKMPAGGWE